MEGSAGGYERAPLSSAQSDSVLMKKPCGLQSSVTGETSLSHPASSAPSHSPCTPPGLAAHLRDILLPLLLCFLCIVVVPAQHAAQEREHLNKMEMMEMMRWK